MKLIKYFAAMSLALSSLPASAQVWELIDTSECTPEYKFQADCATGKLWFKGRRGKYAYYEYWERYTLDRTNYQDNWETTYDNSFRTKVNCEEWMDRQIGVRHIDGDPYDHGWQEIEPGSWSDKLALRACAM